MTQEEADATTGNFRTIYKEELGIHFKKFGWGVCLNLNTLEEIEPVLTRCIEREYVCCATHEQYAYPEYFAYQPDTKEKILKMSEFLYNHGYEFFMVDECLDKN